MRKTVLLVVFWRIFGKFFKIFLTRGMIDSLIQKLTGTIKKLPGFYFVKTKVDNTFILLCNVI